MNVNYEFALVNVHVYREQDFVNVYSGQGVENMNWGQIVYEYKR